MPVHQNIHDRASCLGNGRGLRQVLGIVGALDPHIHKCNQADLQGEGVLEREGVRPQRVGATAWGVPGEARTLGALHSEAATVHRGTSL